MLLRSAVLGFEHMSLLDFNAAARQDRPDRAGRDDRERVERVREAASVSARRILTHLFPQGCFSGSEFLIGDVDGKPGESLRVSLKPGKLGVWSDFAANRKGGDLIDLWMAACGCTFPEALQGMEDFLDLAEPGNGSHRGITRRTDGRTVSPTPAEPGNGASIAKTRQKDLGPPTGTWHYKDASGKIIASVTRYDPPEGKKEFIPWDARARKHAAPDPRPLYNQPGILKADLVVLVEGEKCAEALIGVGVCATTAMGGSNAPPEKTDWRPLAGKSVLIWPDNDEPGMRYAQNAAAAIKATGGKATVLHVPEGKSPKWDAADAAAEGFDVKGFLSVTAPAPKPRISLMEWTIRAYEGAAPDREWLVNATFPMASVSILAAMGDAGKGMLGLDLALKVACDHEADLLSPKPMAFGNAVMQKGTAVILSAEDDRAEVHRRLEQLDPSGRRYAAGSRLIAVPLPNAGGPAPIVVPGRNGPEPTPFFRELREQLLAVSDLRLVIFDPLASFIMIDVNKDPAAGSFATGLLAGLASETGAAILIAHHMNKGNTGSRTIHTPEQARDSIRGTSALVDGVRSAYCLWPMDADRAKGICRKLNVEFYRNRVFSGAIVKSNGPADREVKTFVRQGNGLLVAMDDVLRSAKLTKDELLEAVVDDIRRAAVAGRPFTFSGGASLFDRKEELSIELKGFGRDRLQTMTKELLDSGKVVKCVASGSKTPKWLDVPEGPF
ncbi:MAG: AAA family ATPase, partial [Acidobacteriota bacterium]